MVKFTRELIYSFLLFLIYISKLNAFPFIFEYHVIFFSYFERQDIEQKFYDRDLDDELLNDVEYDGIKFLITSKYHNYSMSNKKLLEEGIVEIPCAVELFSKSIINPEIILKKITVISNVEKIEIDLNQISKDFREDKHSKYYYSINVLPDLQFKLGESKKYSIELQVVINNQLKTIKYDYYIKMKKSFITLID